MFSGQYAYYLNQKQVDGQPAVSMTGDRHFRRRISIDLVIGPVAARLRRARFRPPPARLGPYLLAPDAPILY
jgi:hypothetical protein